MGVRLTDDCKGEFLYLRMQGPGYHYDTLMVPYFGTNKVIQYINNGPVIQISFQEPLTIS